MRKYTRLIRRNLAIALGLELNIKTTLTLPTEFHGSEYGGWAIVKNSLNASSKVISVGVGEDASFDLSIIERYGCNVDAYDPTPKSVEWVEKNINNKKFRFKQYALSDKDGFLRLFYPKNENYVSASCEQSKHTKNDFFDAPSLSFASILKHLDYEKVDILKMDVEGAEYDIIKNMISDNSIDNVKQLLVEFHHFFSGFSIQDTKDSITRLKNIGFEIVWVSNVGHEVLFVKK
jgi:FkbM family methyltransferase